MTPFYSNKCSNRVVQRALWTTRRTSRRRHVLVAAEDVVGVVPGLDLREAARTRQFWLLMAVYGICGFDDFFVATHVVAFARGRGQLACWA